MTNPILSMAALDYMKAGLHVIPLKGKRPNGSVIGDTWSYEESFFGEVESPEEMAALDAAFSRESGTTGIAILIPPDYLVADVDSDRAAQLLLDLGFKASVDTVSAQTKNGIHVWFWMMGADRNRWVGDGQEPNPGRTLLFKGFGGYVVAPPSLHFGPDGEQDGQYVWITPLVVGGRMSMPDVIPAGAEEKFRADDQFAAAAPDKQQMTSWQAIPEDGKRWWQWTLQWNYQLEGLEKAIEKAADGNQNNVIHWAAMTAREEGVPYRVAMERLLAAALRGNHPENRARDTIRGAYRKRGARG